MLFIKLRTNTTLLALAFVTLFSQSCTEPIAEFSFEPAQNVEAFETITFFNESEDAASYDWKFGDGEYSTEENPEHIYDYARTYTVTLTASNDKDSHTLAQTITILEPTILYLEFFESNKVTSIMDCEVWLYDNENDWMERNRPQFFNYTTLKGECHFLNLEDQVYYIRAFKDTETGTWEGSAVLDQLVLNETSREKVNCEFTAFQEGI